MPSAQRDSKDRLILPHVCEADLVKTYKEELDVKLRELAALMNTGLGDGFHTHFSLGIGPDGRYGFSDLFLSKRI